MTLSLLNITPEVARLARDPAAFERAHGASWGAHAEAIREIIETTEAFRARNGAPPEWGGYLAIDPARKRVVGTCAFKGAPIDGVVEIAFFTLPSYEGKGFATDMAAQLIRLCRATPAVRRIVAHTLPEQNPATSVLRKNGFIHLGAVVDPDDGPVWRWQLEK